MVKRYRHGFLDVPATVWYAVAVSQKSTRAYTVVVYVDVVGHKGAVVISRNKSKVNTKPYFHSPHITVHYECVNGDDTYVPGDPMRFIGVKGTFKFIKLVYNAEREVEWVDCMDNNTGEFRSFYSNKIKPKPRPKRKRRKRWEMEAVRAIAAKEQVRKTGKPVTLITKSNQSVGHCSKCRCELNVVTATTSILKRGSGYCRSCMSAYAQSRK